MLTGLLYGGLCLSGLGLFTDGLATAAQSPRLVVVDQDGSGPGGSNQMAMMVLLQSSQVRVLGITMVTGNAWEPEEVQHTLRMLELIHRTDVPVVPGAVFPLVRSQTETMQERPLVGAFAWYGAWGDSTAQTSSQPYHGPFVLPHLAEGEPSTRPLDEDAAHFLIRQVHAHPHQVTVYAAGPLTNIALAISIDPEFAALSNGIVIMGGSLAPRSDDPEFASNPRHEFNFWFDPEAVHITLSAKWPRIELTDVDISVKTFFGKDLRARIAQSQSPAARYIAQYSNEFYYMWDELAAAAWIDPTLITRERVLFVDVDLARGPSYGNMLTWTAADKPRREMQPVHVQEDLDAPRFYRMFVAEMSSPPQAARAPR